MNTKATQSTRHALVEHVLKLVPGSGSLFLNLANATLYGLNLLFYHAPGPGFQLLALLHQALKKLARVFLGLGVCTQTRKPYLAGGILDFVRQLRIIFRVFIVVV